MYTVWNTNTRKWNVPCYFAPLCKLQSKATERRLEHLVKVWELLVLQQHLAWVEQSFTQQACQLGPVCHLLLYGCSVPVFGCGGGSSGGRWVSFVLTLAVTLTIRCHQTHRTTGIHAIACCRGGFHLFLLTDTSFALQIHAVHSAHIYAITHVHICSCPTGLRHPSKKPLKSHPENLAQT